jgi:hypothetical protein
VAPPPPWGFSISVEASPASVPTAHPARLSPGRAADAEWDPMTTSAQRIFERVAKDNPDAGKENLRTAFLNLAMEDDEVLKDVLNDMFELIWTLRVIGEKV